MVTERVTPTTLFQTIESLDTLHCMTNRHVSIVTGVSYLIIFFAAIYANFFALEAIVGNPLITVEQHGMYIRFGAIAFLIAAVFDVVVAWGLFELYKEHVLSRLSAYFRIMHATIMGAAVFALLMTLSLRTEADILNQVTIFNTLWLIGLFFFGAHLMVLSTILKNIRIIPVLLLIAGALYMADTIAHFVLPNYDAYASIFLLIVATPAILGEMSFALWLLFKGGKKAA